MKRIGKTTIVAVAALVLGLIVVGTILAQPGDPPGGISFTISGCRLPDDNHDGLPDYTLPLNDLFVCNLQTWQDKTNDDYTTGNLGKSWNELDLVPFRVVVAAGNSAPASSDFRFAVALDYEDAGAPGYDVISAPVLNPGSHSSCPDPVVSDPQSISDPGIGGIDKTVFRYVDLYNVQQNTICVYDFYGRLALGSHLFPGSSLHANLALPDPDAVPGEDALITTSGIGSKDVSIPVNEISPQELRKDMSATQGQDHVWNISKDATPAELKFENTCDESAPLSAPVEIKVVWEKLEADPSGPVTIITNIYAKNPAVRTITVNVEDKIYAGTDQTVLLHTASSGDVDVPPNTELKVLTHSYVWTNPTAGVTQLNDIATATYKDKVTGIAIPGQTEAMASATIQLTGPVTNATATIVDVESISGSGLSFTIDEVLGGATGTLDGWTWTSDTQTGDNWVQFNKTINVEAATSELNGLLEDVATLTGSDLFTDTAYANVTIKTYALVDLTINKEIDRAGTADETFNFVVKNSAAEVVATPSITILAGEYTGSVTVQDLPPGTYTVSEVVPEGWIGEGEKGVTIDLPSCSDSVTFSNLRAEDLTAEKTAETSYTREYTWEIIKGPDADYVGFIGDPGWQHWYTVTVTRTVTESAFVVSGIITVTNPNTFDVDTTVSDSVGGVAATVDCGGGDGDDTLTVPAEGSATCSYSASLADKTDGINTATITSLDEDVGGATATADYAFGEPTTTIGEPTVHVWDTQYGGGDPQGTLGEASGTTTFTYQRNFACHQYLTYTNGKFYSQFLNEASIVETGQSATALVSMTCYIPLVDKDASATYDETHFWDIEKEVDPLSQWGFAGENLSWTWAVTVTETYNEDNFDVTGVISVTNPAPGMAMPVTLADVVGTSDGADIVWASCTNSTYDTGTGVLTIDAGKTAVCDYNALDLTYDDVTQAPTSNKATATLNGFDFSEIVYFTWAKTVYNGTAVVDDDQEPDFNPEGLTLNAGGGPWNWTETYYHTCSSNFSAYGADGMYDAVLDNEATVVTDDHEDSADATTQFACYAPVVDKDAAGTYDETHTWAIDKAVDPEYQWGFAGEELSWTWTVSVTESYADSNFDVTGQISVTNTAPGAMPVTLADVVGTGDSANIDLANCTNSTYDSGADILTIAAGQTAVCDYEALDLAGYDDVGDAPTTNKATATLNAIPFANTVDFSWTAHVINGIAYVNDLQEPDFDPKGLTLTAGEGPWQWTETYTHTCSADFADYGADGMYDATEYNYASVTGNDGQADDADATTTYACYAPVVDKDAAGAYDETHTWAIEKSVDPTSQWGFAGDDLSWTWTVSVTETYADSNFDVTGQISVTNSAPGAMDITLADVVGTSDGATIDLPNCTNSSYASGILTIAAEQTAVCDYEALDLVGYDDVGDAPTTNTVTATLNAIDFSKTVDFIWTANVINETAVVDDDQEPDFNPLGLTLNAGEGPWEWTETYSHTCSSDFSDYGADGMYDDTLDNYASVVGSDGQTDNADAHTTYACYAPVVDKDAAGAYDETHTWDIEKEVDPTSQGGFAGDELSWTWTVSVTESYADGNFDVTGQISVTNPAPGAMPITLVDVVGASDGATIDLPNCTNSTYAGGVLTIAAGQTAVCDYDALDLGYDDVGDAPVTNVVTATLNAIDFSKTVDFGWTANVINETADVDDDYELDFPTTINAGEGPWEWTETYSHTCSTEFSDYGADGMYDATLDNYASVVGSDGQMDNAEAHTTYACYAPVLDKDAFTYWEERYDWTITKEYDREYVGYIGLSYWQHPYEVIVGLNKVPQSFAVSGTISVTNPAGSPGDMTVSLTDLLATGYPADVDCDPLTEGLQASITVAPGATGTCSYSGDLDAKTDGINTATGTFNGLTFVTTEAYAFGAATPVGYTSVTVTDPYLDNVWENVTGDDIFYDSRSIGCVEESEFVHYKDGVWYSTYYNEACIEETGQCDDALITMTCYAPVLSKDADASYDERHIWDIDKLVGPDLTNLMDLWTQGGYPGDILPWTWYVKVSETFVEENFKVTGKINVTNPAPATSGLGPLSISLSDKLSDGTSATVDCGSGATSISVLPGETGTCDYIAEPDGRTATENEATGTLAGKWEDFYFTATYPVSFEKTVVDGTATATDTYIGMDESLTAPGGPWEYDKAYSHECSSDRADYFDGDVYKQMKWDITNWAYVHSDGDLQDEDDAETIYTCDASFIDVLKWTDGVEDPSQNFTFELRQDGTVLESLTTPPTLLEFQTALRPADEYTLCEVGIPAGWSFQWVLDSNGNGVIDEGETLPFVGGKASLSGDGLWQVYDPDPLYGQDGAVNDTRCVNFPATDSGGIVKFIVDNQYPGGEPRTPGYWKNWNTCTGGNQELTAAGNGGPSEGWYLLDDLIPTPLGDWLVDSCPVGVDILDKREIGDPEVVGDGDKMASLPAFNLATALLAAKLNYGAGAEYCSAATQAIADADAALSAVDFNGLPGPGKGGAYFGKKDAGYVNALAATLDDYNNGILCDGGTAPEPPPPPEDVVLHVADLDGSGKATGKTWTASVEILVVDSDSVPFAGAVVTGLWSDAASGEGSCTTDVSGLCTVSASKLTDSPATFTVDNVDGGLGSSYDFTVNGDPDGDSDGTTIDVPKP